VTNDADHIDDIPPYPRVAALPPNEEAARIVAEIDLRIAWLAERGLRAHVQVLANRQHCIDFLEGGAVRLEMARFRRGGWF
jgi:hypothetical protein